MIRLVLGLLLMPTAVSALCAAGRAICDVALTARDAVPFLIGFVGYPALHFVARPVRTYVFGHELTHALAAWAHGASVLNFAVGRKGGHVDLSHSNAAIALAPYVVPVYAVAVVLAYRGLLWLHPLPQEAARAGHIVFLSAFGVSLSFHLVQTVHALWDVHQPDLDQAGGVVFSLAVIALANGLLLIAWLKCIFPSAVAAKQSFALVWEVSARFWSALGLAARAWLLTAAKVAFP
ncbi:MAG: hypothetical protein HY078_09905 [Elusimicrobia bacterium]|nr:hypothetical protein [Elusimicrobiota bacterium]